MDEVKELREEIEKIKDRNRKVEKDKAWETSWMRKISIIVLTYAFVSFVMGILKIPNPLIASIIPAIGFFLSTLSLGIIKEWWMKKKS